MEDPVLRAGSGYALYSTTTELEGISMPVTLTMQGWLRSQPLSVCPSASAGWISAGIRDRVRVFLDGDMVGEASRWRGETRLEVFTSKLPVSGRPPLLRHYASAHGYMRVCTV
jgi:hypothetical protein